MIRYHIYDFITIDMCIYTSDTVFICAVLCCVKSLSRVRLFVTPWAVVLQVPLFMGILQARMLERVVMPSSRGSSEPRD